MKGSEGDHFLHVKFDSSVFSIQIIMLSSNGEMASFALIRSRHFSAKLGRRPMGKAPTVQLRKIYCELPQSRQMLCMGKSDQMVHQFYDDSYL